jgi:uncharacterized membrane protein YdjX (TVP38/TMEM64 family)
LTPPPSVPSTLSTIVLVTCSDLIPFVPCQPLAITLGASLGINLGISHLCRGSNLGWNCSLLVSTSCLQDKASRIRTLQSFSKSKKCL